MAKGIYRTRNLDSGAEYATVDYGSIGQISIIARELYEERGYKPSYEDLPPCEGLATDAEGSAERSVP